MTTVTAGRLVYGVCYTAALPRDEGQVRAAKLNASSAARQKLNLKMSWQKLEVVIAANFSYRDLFITLTYDDDHLPASKSAAVKLLKRFLTLLRNDRKKRDESLKYVYVTESKHGDARLHHHLVINSTGADYELIRSLWEYGDNIQFEPLSAYGYTELAKYLTKEPREFGSPNGDRTWVPSRGLAHPVSESQWVDENLDLVVPAGAIAIETEQPKFNVYGSYTYIKYLLPEPAQQKSRPKCKKMKKDAFLSDLGHCISSEKD